MKKLLISIAILLFSNISFAHFQSPISWGGAKDPLKSITLDGYVTVPIKVGNGDKTGKFDIYSDNKLYKSVRTNVNEKTSLTVPVHAFNPNKAEVHHVCSVSTGKGIHTKICTKVQIYWNTKDK